MKLTVLICTNNNLLDIIVNLIVDTLFHFLLVWYYCTLTIRERILIANGSRIKGWWNISHFMSTVNSGIMLIWAAYKYLTSLTYRVSSQSKKRISRLMRVCIP
ncbi:unnamed protein product, partial [Trichobilharzia regenti]